ncbi:MAG TPA: sialidase family protein [Candidatus Didemnitutus sp.]|nr:sialidase family protein [Candidatus Didemnitutus sp.]
MNQLAIGLLLLLSGATLHAQDNGPWNSPLMWAEETAPDVFSTPRIFQDSAGVPSMIRKGTSDTLLCAFQWFREPRNTPTWDRVAVKMSTDDGVTWTQPVPIVIDGFPAGYQRPFDPTLVSFNDSIRIYFSSSVRMPMGGLDSLVNTYSAVGTDGIHYRFEPGARFDNATRPVIDPAVSYCPDCLETETYGAWRLTAPIGAPQEGAYQATSFDGLLWTRTNNIPSDNTHNWTGNMLVDGPTLEFYGSGPMMWRASYLGAGDWGVPRNIGLQGGDPTVVARRSSVERMIVFVGPRYTTSADYTGYDGYDRNDINDGYDGVTPYPNPSKEHVRVADDVEDGSTVRCVDLLGNDFVLDVHGAMIDVRTLPAGIYVLFGRNDRHMGRFVKLPD